MALALGLLNLCKLDIVVVVFGILAVLNLVQGLPVRNHRKKSALHRRERALFPTDGMFLDSNLNETTYPKLTEMNQRDENKESHRALRIRRAEDYDDKTDGGDDYAGDYGADAYYYEGGGAEDVGFGNKRMIFLTIFFVIICWFVAWFKIGIQVVPKLLAAV